MALGPHIPAWLKLREALAALAEATGAHNAYVLDAWGNLWCAAHTVDWGAQSDAIEVTQAVLASLDRPLHRGGRLDRAMRGRSGEGHGYAKSFASCYVLLLRFGGPVEVGPIRVAINAALPRITALTVALPPPEGPGSGSAEGFGAA